MLEVAFGGGTSESGVLGNGGRWIWKVVQGLGTFKTGYLKWGYRSDGFLPKKKEKRLCYFDLEGWRALARKKLVVVIGFGKGERVEDTAIYRKSMK